MINCFLPTTPNPTSGFYLLVPATDVRPVDLTVEEAFKLVMSAGLVTPDEAPDVSPAPEPTPIKAPVRPLAAGK